MSKKILTREDYKQKFDELFAKTYYIPQAGEEIRQCPPPYAAYYFLSSECYLFSVYGNKLQIMKLHPRKTGKKNSQGERTGIDWYYMMTVNRKSGQHVSAHKLMIDTFEDSIEHNPQFTYYINEKTEVHHIEPRNKFMENEGRLCNRLKNLQKLPIPVHKRVGYYSNRTEEQIDAEIEEKLKKVNIPNYQGTQNFLETMLQQALTQSDGIIYDNGKAIPISINDLKLFTNDTEK